MVSPGRSPAARVQVPSPLSVPADSVAPVGTPAITIESMVSELSITLADRLIAMAVSSAPDAPGAVTAAASATASTVMEKVAGLVDHRSPSLALKAIVVVPDQFSAGSKVRRPEATASPGITSPEATACPSNRSVPFAGNASMRKLVMFEPSSTSTPRSVTTTGVSSCVVALPDRATVRSFTGVTCTVTVSETVASSSLEDSRVVTSKVTSKPVSRLAGGVTVRLAVSHPVMVMAEPSAVTVLTPSLRTLPAGTPPTRMVLMLSLSSASATAAANGRAIAVSSLPVTSPVVSSASSATAVTRSVTVPEVSDQFSPSLALKVNETSPSQSSAGSNTRAPAARSAAVNSVPAVTSAPFSRRRPLAGRVSMR